MSKRALFVANGIVENKLGVSGGEVRFIEIAKGWNKLGYKIDLLSNDNGKHLCANFGVPVSLHKHKSLKSSTRLNFLLKTFSSFILPKSLKNFEGIVYSTNEQLYDVIPAFILKLRSIKSSKIKWGAVVHWLPPWLFWNRKESQLLNSLLFLVSERLSLYLACLFSDVIFAVSDSTKEQIKRDIFGRFFIHKVKVVFCGVDLDQINSFRKQFDTNKKAYDAVFIKRIQAVKGVFDLVEIWKDIVQKKPDAKLLIMGSGPDEEELKRRIKDNDLGSNIILAGPVLDVKRKYKNIIESKVFILPSYEENWAIVIGEGLAAGVPVVTYALSELQDVWKDSVTYAITGNTDDLSKKVWDILESFDKDKKGYLQLKNKGLDYIKQYSWYSISKNELSHLSTQ